MANATEAKEYRIYWAYKRDLYIPIGQEFDASKMHHGNLITFEVAKSWVNWANAQYPDIQHWYVWESTQEQRESAQAQREAAAWQKFIEKNGLCQSTNN